MDLRSLQTKHPLFEYVSASYAYTNEQLTFTAEFRVEPNLLFHPKVVIYGLSPEQYAKISPALLEKYAFLLGLVEIPSYWKAMCSPTIVISAEHHTSEDLLIDIQNYLFDLLRNGLSEFIFVNKLADLLKPNSLSLRFTAPITTTNAAHTTPPKPVETTTADSILLPLGGGKDSLVALALLKKAGIPNKQLGILVLEPASPAAKQIAEQSGLATYQAKRFIDPQLLTLNKEGYLNGHTPFSAYLSVLSSCVGTVFGYSQVALANERSANEGNIHYEGIEINHQWSKSITYEKCFQNLSARYFANQAPYYFSLLRPLYELQIAGLFANYYEDDLQTLSTFRSCNKGQQANIWCGDCPKCLFAYLILAPFLKPAVLTHIFGSNLLEKPSMINNALDLIGQGETKPLECVGMYEESLLAAHLTQQRYYQNTQTLPVVLQTIHAAALSTHNALNERSTALLKGWNPDHCVPARLAATVRTEVELLNMSKALAYLEEKTVLIIGLGREGKSTYEFLRQFGPATLSFALADAQEITQLGSSLSAFWSAEQASQNMPFYHLGSSDNHTIPWETISMVALTPGISNRVLHDAYGVPPAMPSITNTDLFFELAELIGKDQIVTIGVTGTKGKSTTTALIDHVLRGCGLTTYLGGNIGIPPLNVLNALLQDKHNANEDITSQPAYAVLELSCHQLSRIRHSPQIAVIQAITPEHLDYYLDFEEYLAAKSGISRYQTIQDVVFFNADSASAQQLAELSRGERRGFKLPADGNAEINSVDSAKIDPQKMLIPGKHNVLNALPALVIAEHFGLNPLTALEQVYSFPGLPHRLQLVAHDTNKNIRYYDDSLCTTPEATMAAMASFEAPIVLIAGGYDRHLNYAQLGEFLGAAANAAAPLRALIYFPPSGDRIVAALEKYVSHNLPTVKVETMAEAVAAANSFAQPGDVVLLSPASASFGRFKDYADRGNQFKTQALRKITR